MYGNVLEWVWDRYNRETYQRGESQDPTGPPTGEFRVLRGGSWNNRAGVCRSAYRLSVTPGYRVDDGGFRLALTPGH